jgi:hypothetical protein
LFVALLVAGGTGVPLIAQERRTVAVNVVDEQGRQVTGLKAENFRGKFRGQAVKIVSAEWDAGPRRIVVLLDMSESMDGVPGKWSYAQTAFKGLLAHEPEGARLALVTFDGGPEKRIGTEEWGEAAGLALGELEKPGKREKGSRLTGFLDAVEAGLELLGEARAGDVLYVISDGWSVGGESEPFDKVFCRGVRVFAFGFVERNTGGVDFRTLARDTGGDSLTAVFGFALRESRSKAYVPLEGVPPSLVQMYRQMGEAYRVEVELPREVDKTRGWELEVVDERAKKMKGVRVVYPRKLVPCGGSRDPQPKTGGQ